MVSLIPGYNYNSQKKKEGENWEIVKMNPALHGRLLGAVSRIISGQRK
jgi:hypothetical protein